jgi:hypothetical protein
MELVRWSLSTKYDGNNCVKSFNADQLGRISRVEAI